MHSPDLDQHRSSERAGVCRVTVSLIALAVVGTSVAVHSASGAAALLDDIVVEAIAVGDLLFVRPGEMALRDRVGAVLRLQ